MNEQLAKLKFHTKATRELTLAEQNLVLALFVENYHQANPDYLKSSLKTLRRISIAIDGERLVGFSLADSLLTTLPRIKQEQAVVLGGIGCISSEYRRIGLFSHLAGLAGGDFEQLLNGADRLLACARIAHPASFRTLRRLPGVLPNSSQQLSAWQLEVAAVIAKLYGVKLKPGTLVVQGNGRPVGYPNISLDVSAEEWLPFAGVNREQGDSLLGLAWAPNPPEGW